MISVAFGGGRVRDHFAPSKPRCHFTTPFIYSQPNARIAIVLTPTIADLMAAEETERREHRFGRRSMRNACCPGRSCGRVGETT
jgi:hypothetical protein